MPERSGLLTPKPVTSSLGEVSTKVQSTFGNWFGTSTVEGSDETINTRAAKSGSTGVKSVQIEPPRDAYAKYRMQYDTTPLLSAPIEKVDDDVLADGWRITADDDRTQEFLKKWGEACAIVAGVPGKDLKNLISLWIKCWFIYGTCLIELVPAKERPDVVAGLKMIPPATISYHTRPGSSMLLRPDETGEAEKMTGRGQAAAYTQYDSGVKESWTNGSGKKLSERRLTANQVVKDARNPDIGDITGTSAIESVSEQVESLKETFRNDAKAIESQAWGQWFAGFEPLVIDTADGTEIVEFEDGAQEDFEKEVESVQPGSLITHDGKINIQNLPGEVADVVGRYEFFVDYILSAMPAPKFMTGFADDINRDIAEDQAQSYEQGEVTSIQETITSSLTPIFRQVAVQHGYDPSGIELALEPPADDSPILSLDDADIQNIERYATALDTLSGDAPATTLVSEEAILDLILQLPEDAAVDADGSIHVDESDPEVQKQMGKLQDSAKTLLGDNVTIGHSEPDESGGSGTETIGYPQ